ncbi:MAG: DNA helicase II [Gammaproteobacteria bacterium]
MDVSDLLDPLNDPQREAVTAGHEPVLVLAGAGSGKTRVLAHRIAWLVRVEEQSPWGIMAVTFTNKAAAEMRGRIEELVGRSAAGMWVGTFHGIAHRFLRAHWKEAELPQQFQILDSDDQYRLIKRVLRGLEMDEAKWPPRQIQWYINGKKDEGLRPKHLRDHGDHIEAQMIRVYSAYEEACRIGGLVDFAELLLRAHETLRDRPDVLQHYRERFRFILVDEFQDTNAIQYAWVRLLAGETGKVFVVGDDDQSIYGWRGAKIENIQQVSKDFPGTKTIRLEQNYRSTATILNASNALISHNHGRLGKELWTAGEDGDPIKLYAAFNEIDESRFVIENLQRYLEEGHRRDEVAILYRSNAQSRLFEEQLIGQGIPYRVYGGLRFFERAEIKDALSYLRLVNNRGDDAAFERCINTPPRGIGQRTIDAIRAHARANGIALFRAALELAEAGQPNGRAANAVKAFIGLIDALDLEIRGLELDEQVGVAIDRAGLTEHFKKEKGEKGQARIENLEELVNAARGFDHYELEDGEELDPLSAFLANAALEAGEQQGDAWDDCVQLMTLHSAKGLEFPLVFLCGLEEGLFPHERSIEEPGRLEEERRLCYVGMTRAERNLVISYAERRRLHGRDNYSQPSRFIGEIPAELLVDVRHRAQVSQPVYRPGGNRTVEASDTGLSLGQRVMHGKFGEGTVTNYEGGGNHARVQVEFDAVGAKWLVVGYANLQPL